MVVLASFGYGVGAWYVKRNVRDVQPMAMVGATAATAALPMAPFAALSAPSHCPTSTRPARCSRSASLCTGLRLRDLLLARSRATARRAPRCVGYIAPGFSIVYGVTLLDERFTVATAPGWS